MGRDPALGHRIVDVVPALIRMTDVVTIHSVTAATTAIPTITTTTTGVGVTLSVATRTAVVVGTTTTTITTTEATTTTDLSAITTTTTTKVMTIVATVVVTVAATGNSRCSARIPAVAVARAATLAAGPAVALLPTTDATARSETIGIAKVRTKKSMETLVVRGHRAHPDHHPFRVKRLLRCL